MTRTTADILREARALIDTPEKWIKGRYECNGCFCASGAIRAVSDSLSAWKTARLLVVSVLPREWAFHLPLYNDHCDTTHADIMALFDRAIAEAER